MASGNLLLKVSRPAMAAEFEVFLNAGQYPHGTSAATDALEAVAALERQLSYFQAESELSRINQSASLAAVPVEPGLFGLLQLALEMSAATDGAFDITATPLWEVWGFARRQGRVPGDQELADARKLVGWQDVDLDPTAQTVRFRKPGMRLSLGSIGKGYALDRAAEVLLAAGVNDFLFHGGQSSVLARGSVRSADAPGRPRTSGGWSVALPDPLKPESRLGEFRLRDRALATSGSARQFFRHQGRRYGHVLDPRSGRPAEGVLSATVLAPQAALADALSTAVFVLGPEAGLEFCRGRTDIAAVVISPRRTGAETEIHTIGLGPDDWAVSPGNNPIR